MTVGPLKLDLSPGLTKVEHPPLSHPWKKGVNRAIAVTWHGWTMLVTWVGADIEYETANVGEAHLLNSLGEPPGDGAWCWEGAFVYVGPGDWPGSKEYELAGEWRPATEEEWAAAAADEWPWPTAEILDEVDP